MKEHGECEYNISLKLDTNILTHIQNQLKQESFKKYYSQNSSNKNEAQSFNINEPTVKSNYVMINIYYNNTLKLKGLFARLSELFILFKLSSKIFNVHKIFTCLELKSHEDIKYRTYHKQIFEYDKGKKINELVLDTFNSIGSFSTNSEYCINFDIGLNISIYSDFLVERILNKVSQNQNIELQQLKQNPSKYGKFFTVAIFVEIKEFNNVYPIYGELFQTLKNKLGIKN